LNHIHSTVLASLEIVTTALLKICISSDVTSYRLANNYWLLERSRRLHRQIRAAWPLKEMALGSFETSIFTSLPGVTSQKTSLAQWLLFPIETSNCN